MDTSDWITYKTKLTKKIVFGILLKLKNKQNAMNHKKTWNYCMACMLFSIQLVY